MPTAARRLRPAPTPTAVLGDEEPPDAPVAWAEPGAPDDSVMAALAPRLSQDVKKYLYNFVMKTYLGQLVGLFCCRSSQCMRQPMAC